MIDALRLADRRGQGERGSAALLLVATMLVALVMLLVALADLGRASSARSSAQAAADAAALASLEGGRPVAERFARLNDAVLVSWERGPGDDEVTVVVSVDGVTATARATDAP